MRSAQHKVYIPSSARENQYLLAKFSVTDELLAKFSDKSEKDSDQPYLGFYKKLSKLFFEVNEELNIDSGQFVGNDKFTRVRFSPEKITAQTKQQILFLYNSLYHRSEHAYYNGARKAKKISLVFLSNGNDIRHDSAKFHKKVLKAITLFAEKVGLPKDAFRVCDHQHLTYDLFAKEKGDEGLQVHKLRPLSKRYLSDDVELPEDDSALTYAVADVRFNRRIKQLINKEDLENENYNPLYSLIADAFISSAKQHNLNNGAVIANGLVPVVRKSDDEIVVSNGELQNLGYNPEHTSCGYTCKWSADKLVDKIQFIFVASSDDRTSHGYGKFLNKVEDTLESLAKKLEFVNEEEQLIIRVHQHVGFDY
jgi:hypothetical protein